LPLAGGPVKWLGTVAGRELSNGDTPEGRDVTELGGSQITSLMEVLPGIAQVLRSPVADAIVNLVRAACRVREFDLADAEEVLRYAVRRNLMSADESERILAEARASVERRAERALEREKPKGPSHRPKAQARGKRPVRKEKPRRPAPGRKAGRARKKH
jgi:hypothetical protein